MSLATELEAAKAAALLETQLKSEAAIGLALPRPAISDTDRALLTEWLVWAKQRNVRHAPARPAVVAQFISELAHRGEEHILASLGALAALHDYHGLANPCGTYAVREALAKIIKTEPPRSWPKAEKERFLTLPADIKSIIAKRESERELGMRNLQNQFAGVKRELADERKRKTSGAEKVADQTETKETTNG